MGWWKVQDTENIVGDEVFSTLRNAALEVAATYQREFDRLPTITEWELLLEEALQPLEELESEQKRSLIAGAEARPALQISVEDA